jgi:hypothetical protein
MPSRPPGRWRSPTAIVDTPAQDRVGRLLLRGGTTRRVHPGTVLLVHCDGGPDIQFTLDDGRATVQQIRLASVVGVELLSGGGAR